MKILVANDGSTHARWALQWVAKLPLADPPQVTSLHVLDVGALRAPFVVQPVVLGSEHFIQQEIARMEKRAKQIEGETKLLLDSLRLRGKAATAKGPVAATLLKRAGRGGLIALGSRGLDALDRFMLGSVSSHVTAHAPCSVLIVKTAPRPLRRILFATDGSASSKKALAFLARRLRPSAPPDSPEVVVMHVMPFMRYPELKEAGKALVHRDAGALAKAGYRVKEICQLGPPADELIKVAEHQNADLLVVGAKGLGAVARFFLGSVSTRLVQHSPCSVLVVR